jgi:hypothetical protein
VKVQAAVVLQAQVVKVQVAVVLQAQVHQVVLLQVQVH